MLNSWYSQRNCPKELINILKDKWNRILFAALSCFYLSTCSVIQVGSMLSSQRLNKVMAEVGKNFHETTAKETRESSLPVFFSSSPRPVLASSFCQATLLLRERGSRFSLTIAQLCATGRESGNWTGPHQAWKACNL